MRGEEAQFTYLNHLLYNAATTQDLTDLGISALIYDVNKWAPVDWALSLGGVQSPDCKSFGHSFNRNLKRKAVGDYGMGAQLLYADKSAVNVTANLYWTNVDQMLQFYGQAAGVSFPVGISKTIQTLPVQFDMLAIKNQAGWQPKLSIVYPVCTVHAIDTPIPDTGAIMQNLTIQPRQDPASSPAFIDHYLLLTTTETAAQITGAQGEMPVAPAQDLFPYWNCVPCTVSGSPTSTVIASSANSYLSLTDNSYSLAGCYLKFTSGALKGQRQLITAYVASTRTFTVGTAFTAAPAVGDKAVVEKGFGR